MPEVLTPGLANLANGSTDCLSRIKRAIDSIVQNPAQPLSLRAVTEVSDFALSVEQHFGQAPRRYSAKRWAAAWVMRRPDYTRCQSANELISPSQPDSGAASRWPSALTLSRNISGIK